MITKLESGKKYKIIDKEGYFSYHSLNKKYFEKYAIDDCFVGMVDKDGNLRDNNGYILISEVEAKFFELVEEEGVLTLDTELSFTATCKDWLLVYCLLSNVTQKTGYDLFVELCEKLKISRKVDSILSTIGNDVWLRDTSNVEEAWLESFKNNDAIAEKRKQIEKLQKEIQELENN